MFSQTYTIYIDFGHTDNLSTGNWNNLTDITSGSIGDLINSDGTNSGIAVDVTDEFSGVNNGNGTTSPDPALNFPANATKDSFYGRAASSGAGTQQATGGVTFSNMNPNIAYTFTAFGSRSASDARETKYVVEGATTDEASLNCSSNSSNVAVISNIQPKPDGTIVLTTSPGDGNTNSSKYYYTGVIKITYTVPVSGVELNLSSINLDIGEDQNLVETVSPSNASDKSVEWSSNDTEVATVDANGLVTAVKPGTATITVTTNDGDFTDDCEVTVNCPNVIPANFTAIKGYTEVTLTWDAVEGADGYKIYYGTSSGVYGTPLTINDGTTTSKVFTGLTNGTPYYYAISTIQGTCESDKSTEVSATPSDIYEYENAGIYISTVESGKNLGAGISVERIDGHANLSKGFAGYTSPLGYLVDISVPNGANPLDACLTFTYNPEDLPDGVNIETLDLYRFDEGQNKWVKMNGELDTDNNKVTLCGIDEFSQWTLAGSAPESVPLGNWGIILIVLSLVAGIVLFKFKI